MMRFVRRFTDRKRAAIEAIDPQRFYVENIRAILGLPYPVTRLILDVAVREGALKRQIGLLCPHESNIVASYPSDDMIPATIPCEMCEMLGREHLHQEDEMEHLPFYSLVTHD